VKQKYFILLFNAITAIKIFMAILLIIFWQGKITADSNSFHAHAVGYITNSGNRMWGPLLRALDSVGLYNRQGVTLLLLVLSFFVIPYLAARISSLPTVPREKQAFRGAFLLVALYPTLFIFSLDVFRDVFMVFCFLLALLPAKAFFESEKKVTWQNVVALFLFVALCRFNYSLRPYLGFALFWSFFICLFFSFAHHSLIFLSVAPLCALWGFRALGFLEPLLNYRKLFALYSPNAGTNLGIAFDSIALFPLDFAKSALFQLFGLFFVNITSIFVFCLEGIPFFCGLIYLFKNRRAGSKFVDYLITFFFLYNSIWIIANDNLGTAVRIRIFSYITVLISCMIVYQRKQMLQESLPRKKVPFFMTRLLILRKSNLAVNVQEASKC